MAVGLRVWDANGLLILDATRRVPKLIGSINSGLGSGSFTVPVIDPAASGDIFAYGRVTAIGSGLGAEAPIIRVSGRTFSWSFRIPARALAVDIFYGEY